MPDINDYEQTKNKGKRRENFFLSFSIELFPNATDYPLRRFCYLPLKGVRDDGRRRFFGTFMAPMPRRNAVYGAS